jgi:hypothetical protein
MTPAARLPRLDFVAVGPMRAGTTWLHGNLALHPQIRLPRAKETFFFDRHFDEGIGWYAAHFPRGSAHNPGNLRYGEVGASYFDVTEAVHRIKAVAPACRIIVVVRDPVDRAWSAFMHYRRRARVGADLSRAIQKIPKIVEASRYSVHIPRWERAFGRERVLVVSLAEFRANPDDALGRVCAYLGTTPLSATERSNERVNEGFVSQVPWLQRGKQEVYRFLRRRHYYGALALLRKLSTPTTLGCVDVSPRPRLPRPSSYELELLHRLLSNEAAFLRDRGLPVSSEPGSGFDAHTDLSEV